VTVLFARPSARRLLAATSLAMLLVGASAQAEVRPCQKALAKGTAKLTKQTLKRMGKCLYKDNAGKLPGPCPDAVTAAKLAGAVDKAEAKIAKACSIEDAVALGFPGSCTLAGAEGSAVEEACRALPVSSPAELAECVSCWQQGDLYELLAVLFASHAVEVCGGALGLDSEVCSQGGCASLLGPEPDQRDITGAEADCQRGIAKAALKYLVKRAKWLSKCALAGGTRASCLDDPKMQLRTAKITAKTTAKIAGACRNLRPAPVAPFCCRTGGSSCIAATDREACIVGGGQVQEGKSCGLDGRCDNAAGAKTFTWWGQCPLRSCDAFPIVEVEDVDACVRGKVDETVDTTLCYRFPNGGWPCPSSATGALLRYVD
jgi:hypothetical protein